MPFCRDFFMTRFQKIKINKTRKTNESRASSTIHHWIKNVMCKVKSCLDENENVPLRFFIKIHVNALHLFLFYDRMNYEWNEVSFWICASVPFWFNTHTHTHTYKNTTIHTDKVRVNIFKERNRNLLRILLLCIRTASIILFNSSLAAVHCDRCIVMVGGGGATKN